jgi:putative two-component system response regulator
MLSLHEAKRTDRKPRILVVDDDAKTLELHARLVRALGYETETASDGVEAIAKLPLGVDLVLVDGQMPVMDGFEVIERIRSFPRHRFLPIVMVTGMSDPRQHRRAIEVGVNDFITKPVDADILKLRMGWLLELKRAQDRLEARSDELEGWIQSRTAELRDALEEVTAAKRELHDAHLDTIRRLTVAAEFKDEDTGEHIERIGTFARVVAEAVGMSPTQVETLRYAAPLHDVGKLGIPDRILLKPGKLDEAEWGVMQTHTTMGASLLSNSPSSVIQMGQTIALCHHERWDGGGYPNRITGSSIPLEARICAVVDVFDALTMDRPYRRALPTGDVLDMMREERGKHFDPYVLDAFFERTSEIEATRERD